MWIKITRFYIITISLLIISGTIFAKVNTKMLSYTDVGSGQPIVLIHAFPTDQRLWKPQQDDLKSNFRVITLDLQGFGHADSADGNAITMAEYAEDVKLVLDRLHIQNAVIGGESMGGYIALAFLQKYPAAVNGLILSDTQSIADSPEIKDKREASARDVLDHGTKGLLDGFMTKALSPDAAESVKQNLRNIVDVQSANAIASALRGMALRSDTSDVLATTNIPVLIITGEKDVLILPQQSVDMHRLLKNSKLVVIPNAGHLSSLEQPTAWNQAVTDYVLSINNQSI